MLGAIHVKIKKVIKRNGEVVDFDREKIVQAINKAIVAVEGQENSKLANKVTDLAVSSLEEKFGTKIIPSVEDIQDTVEDSLIKKGLSKVAKAYILYRRERAQLREERKLIPENVREFADLSKKYFRNDLSEFIYYRTYSRWTDEKGRRETWIETVDRFMNFMKENLGGRLGEAEHKELREAILNQEVVPSMRLMWSAGKAAAKTNVTAYNCSYIAPSKLGDFAEIMYLSMCGTGVGFSVESQTVQQLPIVKFQTGEVLPPYAIEDSKEGWGDALTLGLKTWYAGKDIIFDFSKIRPAGARLKTMGGQSSGPEPLRALLDFARKKILSRQGKRLSNIDVHDMICKIGEVVVMGGVRRCLPQNVLVHTKKGLKPMRNIKVGDEVLTSKGRYKKVVVSAYTGRQKLLTVQTQLGTFQSTPEHRWAVLNDLDGGVRWVEAAHLTKNDVLVHIPDIIHGRKTTLPSYHYIKPKYSTTTRNIVIPNLDEEIAWLFGYFHGDGYVYRKNETYGELMFACSPDMPETARRIKQNLTRFNVNARVAWHHKQDRVVRVRVKSNQLANYFFQYKQPNTSLTIPDFILEGTPEIRAAYIAGVFDADGSVKSRNDKKVRPIVASSVYPDWLRQLRATLASIGLSSAIKQSRPAQKTWKTLYHLNIVSVESYKSFANFMSKQRSEKWKNDGADMERLVEHYSFVVPRELLAISPYRKQFESAYYVPSSRVSLTFSKFERARSLMRFARDMRETDTAGTIHAIYTNVFNANRQSYYRPVKIKCVTPAHEEETYDIQVAGDECFVAEGMLVHNSAMISLSDLDDKEMRHAKEGQFYLFEPQRQMANNSTVYNRKPTTTEFMEEWLALAKSGTGERGIFNRAGLKYQLPARRWPLLEKYWQTSGTNPCVPRNTWIMTSEGARQVKNLISRPFTAIVNGKTYKSPSGFFPTGNKRIFRIQTSRGFIFEASDNHKVLTVGYRTRKVQRNAWKEVKDLKVGDEVVLHNHVNMEWEGRGSEEEGWLIGNLVGDGNIEQNGYAHLDYWGKERVTTMRYVSSLVHKVVGGRSDLAGYIAKTGYARVSSKGLGKLASSYGIFHQHKIIAKEIEESSSDFYVGFLRGWFDADGSVQGDHKKGVSVRLASSAFPNLQRAQRMLGRLGIISTLYKNRRMAGWRMLPDGKGGKKKYLCNADHELVISGTNIKTFAERINFSNTDKKLRLEKVLSLYRRVLNKEYFSTEIIKIEKREKAPVFDCIIPNINAFDGNGVYLHNCGEIILRSKQFCNLSEVICRAEDTKETLLQKVRLATILGTYQSSLTSFPYLSKAWKKNCEEERLLGVSLTGQWDCPAVRDAKVLHALKEKAIETNRIYAKKFGINESTCISCIKPSGTVSQLVDCASGMHPRHAKYYIRRIRISATDPLFHMLRDQKFPYYPEVGQPKYSASTYVIEFPVKAPKGAITRDKLSAFDQLEHWKMVKESYTEHNPSVTVSVGNGEWIETANWLYNNWNILGGLSFLPREDHAYSLAPYEEISEERYNEMVAKMPHIDFSQILLYEKEDATQGARELACVAGVCEIEEVSSAPVLVKTASAETAQGSTAETA